MFLFRTFRAAAALLLIAAAHSPLASAEEAPRYDRISLQAQAQREVVHDLMRVTLYSDLQDSDAAKLAIQTTEVLNAATTLARQVPSVSIQTGSRTSHPVYGKDRRRIVSWQERAELHLESGDFSALAALTAQLLGDLKVASQSFAISKASRKTHEDELIQEAIAAFRARAQLAVQAFDGTGYRLVSLSLDSMGFRPKVMMQRMASPMMASAESAPAPQIEAGTSEVGIVASGVIEIQR